MVEANKFRSVQSLAFESERAAFESKIADLHNQLEEKSSLRDKIVALESDLADSNAKLAGKENERRDSVSQISLEKEELKSRVRNVFRL